MVNRNEISRQTAERLHAEAVQREGDPSMPYAFVCNEANHRGLAVERVPAGDVRLRGGLAR